jgi:hypothetical protein
VLLLWHFCGLFVLVNWVVGVGHAISVNPVAYPAQMPGDGLDMLQGSNSGLKVVRGGVIVRPSGGLAVMQIAEPESTRDDAHPIATSIGSVGPSETAAEDRRSRLGR